jgi:hypothetical protein
LGDSAFPPDTAGGKWHPSGCLDCQYPVFFTLFFVLHCDDAFIAVGLGVLYGAVYSLIFLTPIFDYFPWSYGRLVGMLILLALLWKLRVRTGNTFFPMFNAWAESVFGWKAETRTA